MNIAVSSTTISAVSSVTTETVGIGWPAVIEGCHDLLAVAFGTNSMDDPFDSACREADRKAAARPPDPRLKRLRRLLEDDVSVERAYHEIMRARPAPESLVEALMYSLRRGLSELSNADTLHRMSGLDEGQLKAVCHRVQNLKPEIATPWSSVDATTLIAKWRELRG
jgi:hypothetical protein